MKFRPCIDIHNGIVKQIVGGSLNKDSTKALENFVSKQSAKRYAKRYKKDGLTGGHIIMLNSLDSPAYQSTKEQAMKALKAYPNAMQVGGGINDRTAAEFIRAGATHVIVTSFVFFEGRIKYENLKKLVAAVGADKIVLDLSCRKKGDDYFVVTDRWQNFTEEKVEPALFEKLDEYCDEFLVHGVDAEGKKSGMDAELVKILASYDGKPITYAGGISKLEQIDELKEASGGKLDFTIGSALDIFGGNLPYDDVKNYV